MNKTVIAITKYGGVALVAASALGCEVSKSKTPTAPTVAGPIAGITITAPAPVSPANGTEVLNTEPLRLVFGNATSNSERKFWYVVELAADAGFNTKLYTNPRVEPASGSQTTVVMDTRLGTDATYYWRVKADDGANASNFSSVAHFDLVVPVVIEAPTLASPPNGATVANGQPDLIVNNGRVEGRTGDVQYKYEIARDSGFGDIISVAFVPRSGGPTTKHTSAPLPGGLTLYWRVTATNGSIQRTSGVASFRTPSVGGGGGGGGQPPTNPGGPCNSSNPETIVQCERAKYGRMSDGQMLDFLRNVARSLNRNGISGGPFGVLRKSGGHNCGGYSCDIVCAGSGTGQRQHDVIGDIDGAQSASWGPPKVWPDIRIDTCDIQ